MTAKSYWRGHEIIHIPRTKTWVYKDTRSRVDDNPERKCARCGKSQTKEKHDACLGHLPGVINACCGHGKDCGYVQFENDVTLRGNFIKEEP